MMKRVSTREGQSYYQDFFRLSAYDCGVAGNQFLQWGKDFSPQRGVSWMILADTLHSCTNHYGMLTAFIFSADNSPLRSLVSIIYFHLIFQDGIIHINDTWCGTNGIQKSILAEISHRSHTHYSGFFTTTSACSRGLHFFWHNYW